MSLPWLGGIVGRAEVYKRAVGLGEGCIGMRLVIVEKFRLEFGVQIVFVVCIGRHIVEVGDACILDDELHFHRSP